MQGEVHPISMVQCVFHGANVNGCRVHIVCVCACVRSLFESLCSSHCHADHIAVLSANCQKKFPHFFHCLCKKLFAALKRGFSLGEKNMLCIV